jgi:hypothetical protein
MFDEQLLESLNSLLQNAILLFGLGFLFAAASFETKLNKTFLKVVTGLIIGGIAILIMRNPWELEAGLIFDTRSVLLSQLL